MFVVIVCAYNRENHIAPVHAPLCVETKRYWLFIRNTNHLFTFSMDTYLKV